MSTFEAFVLFAIADLMLKLTPGPDMALTMTRGMTQGFKAAWTSVLGTCTAGLVQIPVVVLGLAAVIQKSPALFAAVKVAGAFYLIYLGINALRRSRTGTAAALSTAEAQSAREIFWQGFTTNLLNPKVLLFMIAFLPQFADPSRGPVAVQVLALAVYSKTMGLVTGAAFAFGASNIRRWFLANPWFSRAQDGALGVMMLSIGISILSSRDALLSLVSGVKR